MSQSKLVGVVETAVHGCRGFHVRLDPDCEMPKVGTPLYAAPQLPGHIVDANKMVSDLHELRKWLNEQPNREIDRQALARVLAEFGDAEPLGRLCVFKDDGAAFGFSYDISGNQQQHIRLQALDGAQLYAAPQPPISHAKPKNQAEPNNGGACVSQPVAWWLHGTDHVEFQQHGYHDGPEWTPLYTAPQPPVSHAKPENQAEPNNGGACVSQPVAAQCRFEGDSVWQKCGIEHHEMVQANPHEWPGYVTRLLYDAPQPTKREPAERTLLEQYDLDQSPDYRKGYEDGRLKGYEVGSRHAAEQEREACAAIAWNHEPEEGGPIETAIRARSKA